MLVRLAVGVIVGLAYVVMSQMLHNFNPGGTSMFGSNSSTQFTFTVEEPVYSGQDSSSDDDSFGYSR